jgi:hypoxanthine phosphoribosyltransferase
MAKILFTAEQVTERIGQMAGQIAGNYDPKSTLFVALLNGAVPFTVELMRAIERQNPDFHPDVQYMKVSRYGTSREPGELQVINDLPLQYHELKGRAVVLLDDLLDAGGTLTFAKQRLMDYGAAEVDCAVLVKKLKQPPVDLDLALYGFEAPDEWLVGMGMDDSSRAPEANRWSPWIGIAD